MSIHSPDVAKKPKTKYKPTNIVITPREKEIVDIVPLKTTIPFEEIIILKKIGNGSQGHVKKVQVKENYYALKCIPVEDEEQKRKNLITEYKTLLSCYDPNIVQLHEVYSRQGHVYMLLEYMNAGSLEKVLKTTGKIPEGIISKIAEQVLKGLLHIHEKKFIHRDIKPANILLNLKGDVKIADFGMAGLNKSIYTTYQGTMFYMSPERLKGEDHTFNSDIWSLGLTLAECGIGKFPFDLKEKTIWEIMQEIDKPKIPFLEEHSKEFIDFITQCACVEKETRPSAQDLLKHDFIQNRSSDVQSVGRWLHENYVKVIRDSKKKD